VSFRLGGKAGPLISLIYLSNKDLYLAKFYAVERKVKVGIVQMACSPVPSENLEKVKPKIIELAKKERKSFASGVVYFLYFCDEENHDNFKLAESIPGPSTQFLSPLAKEYNIVIIASLFEKRAEGLYHNTTAVMMPVVNTWANTARCIFLTTRDTTRNFTLHPAISGTKFSKQNMLLLEY